jgi:predicted nucleic acid-binding protein
MRPRDPGASRDDRPILTPEGLAKARELLDCARCIPLTDALAEKTIELRTVVSVSLPDAVIAASAVSLDAVLVTRNEKDFARVPALRIFNPITSE